MLNQVTSPQDAARQREALEPPKTLNQDTERLLVAFTDKDKYGTKDAASVIHVNAVVSRMASLYERLRNAIDYRDEHLLRKNAIERIIRRLLAVGHRDKTAGRLIRELIQARYLPNDRIPESRVRDVQAIVNKYLALLDRLQPGEQILDRSKLSRWFLGIASVEIEHALVPYHREDALLEYAYTQLKNDVRLADKNIPDRERDIQLYLAIHRALLKSDVPILSYHLMLHYFPGWERADAAMVQDVASRGHQLRAAVEGHLFHAVAHDTQRRIKRYMMLFHILQDVIEEDPAKAASVLKSPSELKRAIREAASERYRRAKKKLWGRITRSVIYILITKTALAFLFELPYELYFLDQVNWMALGINVIFFPLMLLVLAITIRIPADKNTEAIIYGISSMIYTEKNPQLFAALRKPIKRSPLLTTGFRIFYLITFLVTFGLIIWGLRQLGFNVVSITLFLFFLSVVSFVGIRIRIITQELVVVSQREGLFPVLVDFFTLPIISVGRWIAEKAPKVNLIVFIMDFIIETPFKISIQFIEEWIAFMREKKEEIY